QDGTPMPYLPTLVSRFGVPAAGSAEPRVTVERSLRQSIEARVLERYAPVHVVITRDGDIVNYSSGTGKYLEPPPGRPSRSIMAMARRGLRFALRSALHEAIETGRPAVRDNVALEVDGREFVRIAIEPVSDERHETLYLVLFTELRAPVVPEEP